MLIFVSNYFTPASDAMSGGKDALVILHTQLLNPGARGHAKCVYATVLRVQLGRAGHDSLDSPKIKKTKQSLSYFCTERKISPGVLEPWICAAKSPPNATK